MIGECLWAGQIHRLKCAVDGVWIHRTYIVPICLTLLNKSLPTHEIVSADTFRQYPSASLPRAGTLRVRQVKPYLWPPSSTAELNIAIKLLLSKWFAFEALSTKLIYFCFPAVRLPRIWHGKSLYCWRVNWVCKDTFYSFTGRWCRVRKLITLSVSPSEWQCNLVSVYCIFGVQTAFVKVRLTV